MIFLKGKTSRNLEMKSGVLELVMAENLVLFAFLQVRVIPLSGKEIMAFLQSIMALLAEGKAFLGKSHSCLRNIPVYRFCLLFRFPFG